MAAVMSVFRDHQTNIAGMSEYVKQHQHLQILAVRMEWAPANKTHK